jgi:glycosyltransferase involved in cell wall biosynthesis
MTIGIESRIEIIRYLTNHFKTTVITNNVEFIKMQIYNCNVIKYNYYNDNILINNMLNYFKWKKTATMLNDKSTDMVFMFEYTTTLSCLLKHPKFIYVSQYGNRSSKKVNLIKSIYRSIAGFLKDKFYLAGLKNSETVFVVSEPIVKILKKKGVKNLVHTPHGINIKKFRNPLITDFHTVLKEKKNDGYFIVSYTGWVSENRGYQLMVDSLKEAVKVDKKIMLVIAGADENFSGRITEFTEVNNLQENIINFGVIDVSFIPGILHYSDVCLSFLGDVPAYRISPPQKVLEYFAAGKPVICNKIETHEILVTHKKNGLILDYDALEVKNAILELKDNKKLLNEMSRNAQEEAKKHDINVVYGKLVNKMKEIIDAN